MIGPTRTKIVGDADSQLLMRTVAFALRHHPELFYLELDSEGWADLNHLLMALRYRRNEWADVTVRDLQRLAGVEGERRLEIVGDRIRALYGHSNGRRVSKAPAPPPSRLFHGTDDEALPLIGRYGLQAMGRNLVHLTTSIDYAASVAVSKGGSPVVVGVFALAAAAAGAPFYPTTTHVWLAGEIEPQFLFQLPRWGHGALTWPHRRGIADRLDAEEAG